VQPGGLEPWVWEAVSGFAAPRKRLVLRLVNSLVNETTGFAQAFPSPNASNYSDDERRNHV
jgi:hypothetical protein